MANDDAQLDKIDLGPVVGTCCGHEHHKFNVGWVKYNEIWVCLECGKEHNI